MFFGGGVGEVLVFLEDQGGGIQAVAKAGGLRAVLENVAEMAVAQCAKDLGAVHAVAQVLMVEDVLSGHRGEEAGPACARVKFCLRREEGETAADAVVNPGLFGVVKRAAKGRFGALAPGDLVFARGQEAAPFSVGLDDLGNAGFGLEVSLIIQKSNFNHRLFVWSGRFRGGLRRRLRERRRGAEKEDRHQHCRGFQSGCEYTPASADCKPPGFAMVGQGEWDGCDHRTNARGPDMATLSLNSNVI